MLPPEIIDYIFSFLHSDRVTLETCSRAHPILSKLVQQHLYANITIRNDSAEVFRLSKLVSDIANYVRSLHITIEWRGYAQLLYKSPLVVQDIAMILPKFRMLRKIIFDDRTPARWLAFHERFRAAFIQCLRLPSMIEVSIHGNEFPLNAFVNCMSIKKLTLDGTFTFDELSADSTLPYTQIESLSIRRCSSSLSPITSWAETCNPRSLGLRLPCPYPELQLLLQVWSNTLTSLELYCGSAYITTYDLINKTVDSPPPIPFDLSCLTKVEDLSMHASLTSIKTFWINSTNEDLVELRQYGSSLPTIATLVRSVTFAKRLALYLCFKSMDSFTLPEVDWSPLDLPLECIDLYVSTQASSGVSLFPEDLLACLEGNADLMRMVKQGVLTIKTEQFVSIL